MSRNNSNPILEAKGLRCGYKNIVTADNVSFAINPAEILGFIGLNGAGKTTLIKTLMGLRTSLAGNVITPAADKIAYLPERFMPPLSLSGEAFISFAAGLYKYEISKDALAAEAAKLRLSASQLKKPIGSYSKGMRQKIGLLSTLMMPVDLIILDEPMNGLDPAGRDAVKKIMIDAKAQGRSVFFTSHILSDMAEICARVIILHDQNLRYDGPPDTLLSENNTQSLEKAFLNKIMYNDNDMTQQAA